jgi:DNA-3-methyladenine glycosylase I
MAKDLKKHNFKFVGPTICYAFMQAVGIVHDHVVGCPQRRKCSNNK